MTNNARFAVLVTFHRWLTIISIHFCWFPKTIAFLRPILLTPSHKMSEVTCKFVAKDLSRDMHDFSMLQVYFLSLLTLVSLNL